jgi:hypothetical protein
MADLSAFGDASVDLVVNPISTLFVDVGKVWRECRRVLVSHGVLIAGFMNPDEFVFDPNALDERGEFVVRYPLPYVEHERLDAAALEARIAGRCSTSVTPWKPSSAGSTQVSSLPGSTRTVGRGGWQPDPVLHAEPIHRASTRHRPP